MRYRDQRYVRDLPIAKYHWKFEALSRMHGMVERSFPDKVSPCEFLTGRSNVCLALTFEGAKKEKGNQYLIVRERFQDR